MAQRRAFIAGLLSLALAACASGEAGPRAQESRNPPGPTEPLDLVVSSGKVIHLKVEVVADDASRERGLMFRRSLPDTGGMLFDFKSSQPVAFWMRNTFIPLDIIFIDKDGRVLNIARQAKPFDETPLPSAGPALGVLEINGGLADRLGFKEGDHVRHRIFARAAAPG